LEAARAVMREEGVAALNLNEVARRVGVRTPSLYEYFPGKMALYDALFRLGIRRFAARMERARAGMRPGWGTVRARFEGYLGFAQENPELFYLLFERPVPGFVPSEESMAESRQVLEAAGQILREELDSGLFDSGLPLEQTRDLLIALMHG